MNSSIAKTGALIQAAAVIAFAVFMLIDFKFGSYIVCMFIALGFVMMISGFHAESDKEHKAAANTALILSGIYAVLILIVYFAQTTAVRLDSLSNEALKIIDYQRYGLYFSYDLLGYGIMALATFFIGLAFKAHTKQDKWLKALLLIHGIFFICCFILPMLGLFNSQNASSDWIGTLVLEFWCLYYLPICILSYRHFSIKNNTK